MSTSRFFTLLALVTLLDVVGVVLCHVFLPIDYALPFSVATVVLFIIISVVLFFLGRRSAGAKNRMLFSNVFLGATMVKMLLCGMLVVGYVFLGSPASRLFILPFFWSYIVYTGYEVYYLMKLSGVVAQT
jgi:hypothetical protein